MKYLWANPLIRSRFPLAILAGLMLTAAYPRLDIACLAWIAPAVMIVAAWGKGGGESFRIGYVAGLTHYLSMLYWLLLIPYRWHGIPLGPAAGWLSLSAVLALFPATWVWLVIGGNARSKSEAENPGSEVQGSLGLLAAGENFQGIPGRSWARRTLWALSGAAVWVALEMVMARLLGGFPWDLLGVSQYQLAPLIQLASVTGVYGVSFLVVWFSLSLVSAGVMLLRRPTLRSVWLLELFLPILAVAVVFNFGFRQINRNPPAERTLKVTLIQPSIPQTLIWNPGKDDERFREVIRLSEQALTNQTDLLIWPESAVPKMPRYDKEIFAAVTGLAREHRVWMILGADDAEPRRSSPQGDEADYFNSSFLINPEGQLVARYKKRSLVIFGEFIPLSHTLPFLKWFTPIQGGFTPGEEEVPFELTDLEVKTSVLICFEDIFPQLGRTRADVDFLVNITNDGWFGESAAQWQQAVTALFRAVENRVPLIRCTNNGLTCWIDAYGRIRQSFRDQNDTIYGPGFMTAQIPLPGPGQRSSPTFYHRHGDWLGWTCFGVAVMMVGLRLTRGGRRGRNPKAEG